MYEGINKKWMCQLIVMYGPMELLPIFSPMQNKPNTYTRFVMCLEDHHIQRDRQTPGTYIWWSLKQSHWRLLVQCTMMVNEWPLMNNSLHLVLQTICVLSTPLFPYVKNLHVHMTKDYSTYSYLLSTGSYTQRSRALTPLPLHSL